MKAPFFATALTLAALTIPASAATVRDWSWINGTTWIVPQSGLPAYVYSPSENQLLPVQDQTVYTITGYRNGYFWGRTAAKLGSNTIACKSLVGSVTPEGKIYLTFTDYPYEEGTSTTTIGIGTMVLKGRQWTMANQMSTGSSAQVGHWAYMVMSRPGSATWYSLPGVDMSVPDFMEDCMDAAPQTPG